jgi:hypothetical protein
MHKYEDLRHEDHDHDESSTEVESLTGEDKRWHAEQHPRIRSKRSGVARFMSSCRWVVDTILLVIILGLLVRQQMKEAPVNTWEFLGDLTGVAPRCKLLA